ncbi:hypothetical protein SEMRO_477_G150660.1 [Seminavis robusta]|uniref:Uncharacterized protein n=1 Tax=Seminavis robusta TaxID=568900 RepID=A0A9N8DYH8_9STRA|nr:hypothetical protein SEMRO_477_G150660.1 [Seminavis robusta]|eukprot:Sro477_g150660.1 n/a (126) ;mRNA; r:5077-5454
MQLAVTVDATFEHIYMSGDYEHHYLFASVAFFVVWDAGVRTIKDVIANINNDGNAGDARVPEYRRWLALVRAFGLHWGGGLIPGDIKAAVNDVETNIGVHVTDWDHELPAPYDEDTDDDDSEEEE